MQVLLDKPLGLFARLETIYAGILLRETKGWWRVLLFGRTGKPTDFSELVDALSTAAELNEQSCITAEETAAMLAVLAWTPRPIEHEWFVVDLKLGKGIYVDAFIDTQIRGMEHDGWDVASWLYPTESYYRRFVLHASRRMCPLELVDAEQLER